MEIQGHESYLIYDDGRVYSKKRNIFMRPHIVKGGYHQIGLYDNNKQKQYYIHRLVGEHYIPNPYNYKEVDHIDRNPNNNDISNLRWCSPCMNGLNKGKYNNNTSGQSNIVHEKRYGKYRFRRSYYKKTYSKNFNNKTDALCYKYIFLLRMKAGHFDRLN